MEFGDKEISYHCLPPPHPLIVLQQEYSVSGIYGGKKSCNFEENTESHLTCFSSLICMCREPLKKSVQSEAVGFLLRRLHDSHRSKRLWGNLGLTSLAGWGLPWCLTWCLEEGTGKGSYTRIFPNSFQQV